MATVIADTEALRAALATDPVACLEHDAFTSQSETDPRFGPALRDACQPFSTMTRRSLLIVLQQRLNLDSRPATAGQCVWSELLDPPGAMIVDIGRQFIPELVDHSLLRNAVHAAVQIEFGITGSFERLGD